MQEFLNELELDEEVRERVLKQHEAELGRVMLNNAVLRAVDSSGARDKAAVHALLAKEELDIDNLDTKLEALKKEHPVLFDAKVMRIVSTAAGDTTVGRGGFAKLGYMERLRIFRENPELYSKLV